MDKSNEPLPWTWPYAVHRAFSSQQQAMEHATLLIKKKIEFQMQFLGGKFYEFSWNGAGEGGRL